MVDVVGTLLTAGLSLASKLIMSWVEKGRDRVKVSEVESSITREVKEEAARLRVRVDDLEQATQKMLRELVDRSPEISYSRGRLFPAPALDLRFDRHDPASSKQLLSDLRARVAAISADLTQAQTSDDADGDDESQKSAAPKVVIDPPSGEGGEGNASSKEKRRSAEMIEQLRARVTEAEQQR